MSNIIFIFLGYYARLNQLYTHENQEVGERKKIRDINSLVAHLVILPTTR
jgi:hypothetical protein